ncbi:outer membrane protein OmpA-like peptidoglycan-associated protein [Natronocella acetinitrilica]|uniref:Outer membrane protein OmpA-like peptidoglycan-associated protein n=1 Tax=Natronocella acetinitrilica TaxID=414046 RepID=A0AAE3KHW4_9GAMM|nr:OmpA family protein [Natronocella acetinitrilica]MCP1676762.1 outer membrane protein OmpA-like peptidoglycan-associated protein [Natronocella acetinitrilica]
MNTRTKTTVRKSGAVTALALSVALLAACASTPESPSGASALRSNLSALQNDPDLAERARVELREAEEAVQLAEQPLPSSDARLAEHRVYMAEQKIEIARAKASTRYAEYQRQSMEEARSDERLTARTEEADRARAGVADLQRQIATLQAEVTDRGIVLTLGDVLFATGSAELQPGADGNLNRLVDFLNEHPERRVLIEGHTDSVGSAESNQRLSQRRADAVRSHLVRRGLSQDRLSTSGMGEDRPVASNETASGRQQNRRVEIIIENAPLTSGAGS